MRLVQLINDETRRIAMVEQDSLKFLDDRYHSIYQLVFNALDQNRSLSELVPEAATGDLLDYQPVYQGESDWKLLPSFDHPHSVSQCMLSGTGLTHKASATNRERMHQALEQSLMTDSMAMYLWGEKEGKPAPGKVGIQPEWFYKGNGSVLRAHLDELQIPSYGDDGGEEAEIAGVYVIDNNGQPVRIGFTMANEFSDHVMERKNYLYLAPSKLRECAIGPELVLDNSFNDISGKVSILRNGEEVWASELETGEAHITHTLSNLEYHHFKYQQHRLPGQVHIHFFGTSAFSFGQFVELQSGDEMRVAFDGFGRPLRNFLILDPQQEKPVDIRTIY